MGDRYSTSVEINRTLITNLILWYQLISISPLTGWKLIKSSKNKMGILMIVSNFHNV